MNLVKALARSACLVVCAASALFAQQKPSTPPDTAGKAPVERVGPDSYRVGSIQVDTAKRIVSVRGGVNQVQVLEFLANARGGMKAYETALTLDADAISFNLALVLVGLEKSHARTSTRHFDPAPVSGDPVEIMVSWVKDGQPQRAPIERLLYDKTAKEVLPPSDWVYTGSTFTPEGRYLAEVEGTLIGFAHTPSSVIESARGIGLGRYGSIVLNPDLGLAPGAPITLHIRALDAGAAGRK
jgi:hypothetical protein